MKLFLVFTLLAISTFSIAQKRDSATNEPPKVDTYISDTLYTAQDTAVVVETEDYSSRFIPRRASLYSAVLPGLGQAYNKRYWKVPIVYGGFIALGITIDFYHDNYIEFRRALFAEIDNNDQTVNNTGFSTTQLERIVERTRRDRDFWIIMTGVFYFLQIAEAHIDAHLKEFKLNPDLQVEVAPKMRYDQGLNTGLQLTFKF